MNRRAFTLIELIIVILIIVIIAAIAIPNIVAAIDREDQQRRQNVSTPVTTQIPGTAHSPERPPGYEVHTVNVPFASNILEGTRIHETLVSWLREHPSHEIISIIRTDGGLLVIVTKNR